MDCGCWGHGKTEERVLDVMLISPCDVCVWYMTSHLLLGVLEDHSLCTTLHLIYFLEPSPQISHAFNTAETLDHLIYFPAMACLRSCCSLLLEWPSSTHIHILKSPRPLTHYIENSKVSNQKLSDLKMNSAMLQDTILTYRNLLCFCT